jgi:hypothetical protein
MCAFWTRLIDSTPPATTVSMPSAMICFAPMEMLMSPEEHWRSTLCPAMLTGNPAAITHWRATLKPCVPCCSAAPMITSSISPGSRRAREIASLITGAAIDGDSMSLKAPR